MEEFFGAITPALLVAIVSFVTEMVKKYTGWEDWKADLTTLVFSYLVLVPFYIISTFRINPPNNTWDLAWVIFTAAIYPVLGWIFAGGYYSKFLQKRNQQ